MSVVSKLSLKAGHFSCSVGCSKVFTSIQAQKYHSEKGVCLKQKVKEQEMRQHIKKMKQALEDDETDNRPQYSDEDLHHIGLKPFQRDFYYDLAKSEGVSIPLKTEHLSVNDLIGLFSQSHKLDHQHYGFPIRCVVNDFEGRSSYTTQSTTYEFYEEDCGITTSDSESDLIRSIWNQLDYCIRKSIELENDPDEREERLNQGEELDDDHFRVVAMYQQLNDVTSTKFEQFKQWILEQITHPKPILSIPTYIPVSHYDCDYESDPEEDSDFEDTIPDPDDD